MKFWNLVVSLFHHFSVHGLNIGNWKDFFQKAILGKEKVSYPYWSTRQGMEGSPHESFIRPLFFTFPLEVISTSWIFNLVTFIYTAVASYQMRLRLEMVEYWLRLRLEMVEYWLFSSASPHSFDLEFKKSRLWNLFVMNSSLRIKGPIMSFPRKFESRNATSVDGIPWNPPNLLSFFGHSQVNLTGCDPRTKTMSAIFN